MSRNLVLVQPQVGDMDLFRDRPTPPLGLLCAASGLPRDLEVRFVDQRIHGDWRLRLAAALDEGTVAVGITTFTGQMIRHALEAAREAKRRRDVPVVWGGIHPSLLPEQTVADELADYVVAGEGELAFAELVGRLAAGLRPDGIPGVWSKGEGGVAEAPRTALLDLDRLPTIPYGLVDMEAYIQTFRGQRMFFYQSSRGCPARCAYCYNPAFNLGRWRALEPGRVVAELAELRKRFDFPLVYFLDDNFFINIPRAMRILSGLKEQGLAVSLQGVDIETLARLSDADLDFLEAAGVERITVGVESGVDRVRAEVLKKVGDVRLVREQLARFQGRRIIVLCSFVVGLPSEDFAEMRRTMDFAMEIMRLGENYRVPQFYNYAPYPGTELFARLQREGFPFPARLSDWGAYEWDYSRMHRDQPRVQDALERMCFLSKFLDRKMDDFRSAGTGLRALYNIYRPIARARLRHGILRPLPERRLYEMLKGFFG